MIVKLKIKKNGRNKEYTASKITGRFVREGLQLQSDLVHADENGMTQLEYLDRLVEFSTQVFKDSKLTNEDILDGLDHDNLYIALEGVVEQVIGIKQTDEEENSKN